MANATAYIHIPIEERIKAKGERFAYFDKGIKIK